MYYCMVDGGMMWAVQDTAVTQKRDETRDMQDKNKSDGPSRPSNYSFIVKSKER